MTTITTMPDLRAFRTQPVFGFEQVDRANKVIRGATVIQLGEVKDARPMFVDQQTLEQVVEFGNQGKGPKARMSHPNMSDDGFGKHLGRWQNFRIEETKVKADLPFDKAASSSPEGDLASYIMDRAEEDPDSFGVSVAVDFDEQFQSDLEEAWEAGDSIPLRIDRLRAADFVGEPAATDGLFQKESPADLPAHATRLLDRHFENASPEVIVARVHSFLDKYFATKGVEFEVLATKPREEEEMSTEKTDGLTMEEFQLKARSYTDAFGDKGAAWFLEGKSFDECRALQIKELQDNQADLVKQLSERDKQIEELQKQVNEQFGEADAIDTGEPARETPKKPLISIVGQ